jgi:hypothetical protein
VERGEDQSFLVLSRFHSPLAPSGT